MKRSEFGRSESWQRMNLGGVKAEHVRIWEGREDTNYEFGKCEM